MRVTGPFPRELSSILAQLRHFYRNTHAAVNGHPDWVGPRVPDLNLLSKQIERLERLQREMFGDE
jgi:hypothetical protein